ncbi:phospholipase A1-Igamma1, chloroplastic-like [Alnus glutinosa]|uniref:phospholipase A1-Igamma1, chloroplastic-like n=1 Tax=Alnus glutinosa TaxID=3517 RepID=UPI002D78A446|nr:phospholipase A1-Igamma1, chloroplastic-like [Alnus glutinosa]
MAISTMIYSHLPATTQSRLSIIHAHKEALLDRPQAKAPSNPALRLAESLSHLLHLHVQTPPRTDLHKSIWSSFTEEKHSTPTTSPKEVIAHKWRDVHGSSDWDNLLDPLQPWLRREIVKYGEFAQATYDAFDFDSFSEYCGSCRYNPRNMFEKLGLTRNGYTVSNYVYGMSNIHMPQWLERSHLADTWSKDSNWIGYVAVSDDEETRRIGRRDIVVAWRGTVAPSEWYEDMQRKLEPFGEGDAKVEHGFLSLYTSKNESTRYNKTSASEQAMKEVTRLVEMYREKGEEVSLTVTGHSLGGALALLNAYEAAATIPNLPVSVISFGAPRVGNVGFRDELHQLGVKTLRVVIKQDVVPRMPGLVFNESLQKFDDITGSLEWVYTHVGAELKLDVRSSPYLKRGFDLMGFHSLETYLHLVDGFLRSATTFRSGARRDVALVNKACDMLVDELRIPRCWYQLAHKGLVRNTHGRWVKPKRDAEDIPSPAGREESTVNAVAVGMQAQDAVESALYALVLL